MPNVFRATIIINVCVLVNDLVYVDSFTAICLDVNSFDNFSGFELYVLINSLSIKVRPSFCLRLTCNFFFLIV